MLAARRDNRVLQLKERANKKRLRAGQISASDDGGAGRSSDAVRCCTHACAPASDCSSACDSTSLDSNIFFTAAYTAWWWCFSRRYTTLRMPAWMMACAHRGQGNCVV